MSVKGPPCIQNLLHLILNRRRLEKNQLSLITMAGIAQIGVTWPDDSAT